MKYLKIIFAKLFIVLTIYTSAQTVTDQIKLNQVGFYPASKKISIVTGQVKATPFYITSTNLSDTLFTGPFSDEMKSGNSDIKSRVINFSSFQKKGSYVVVIPGLGHSYIFNIADSVHKKVAVASLKGFYYQRVSMPLEEKYAGKWHRSAGHKDDVVYVHPSAASTERPAGTALYSAGGWYDAGDYNKYIVNSGITMGTLFSAYEDFPRYFNTVKTNIPESSDGIPDLLNELIYNLRWMLSMQDPNDGGVYHKCTNASFDGMVMPGVTKAARYVVQKGTAAALDFTAVTAQAARVLRKYNKQLPGLADSCINASLKAWKWAEKHPSVEYNQDEFNKTMEPDIVTGGYGDKRFTDEWTWAAAELYVTTKSKIYYEAYVKYKADSISLPGWSNVEMLGHYTLLRYQNSLPAYMQANLQRTYRQLIQLAERYITSVQTNAFQTVMGQSRRDFNWGSNANAANQGIILVNAYLLSKNTKYLHHALSNIDYILGRNATGYSFITGFGSKSPMKPHHRQSAADGITEPVPGLLAGGPNPGKQDNCQYEFSEPETTYADVECSYASNEIAINWNAPLVYLLHAIEALQNRLKTN